jgi:NAD(P)-dependent dehydrogenase (short-subunit alcohol dehydrogenase family)
MLAVTGHRSQIVTELRKLLPAGEEVASLGLSDDDAAEALVLADRYLLCAGLLRPKGLWAQSFDEIEEGLHVNCIRPLLLCDQILASNDQARIVVMGSESGFTWSFDGVYAASKAALHKYVETKKLKPHQQLVCVAPSIIRNTGMTERRKDVENLERRRNEHPKKRFLEAIEVAKLIHFLLYVDEGYLSGQVIRMNGGV